MNKLIRISELLLVTLCIYLDQFTKGLAVRYLKDGYVISLIPKVLELRYLENRGAAFGILQNQRIFFLITTTFTLILVLYILFKIPMRRKYFFAHFLLILILSGGVGNMIDRIGQGYVVDFIYFSLINFPIFNVADIYATVATFGLAIALLFIYRDDDFNFLRKKTSGEKSDE